MSEREDETKGIDYEGMPDEPEEANNVDELAIVMIDAAGHVFDKVKDRIISPSGLMVDIDPDDHDLINDINDDIKEGFKTAIKIVNNKLFFLRNEGGKGLVGYYNRKKGLGLELKTQAGKEFLFANANFKVLTQIKVRPRAGVEHVYKSMAQMWFDSPERKQYEGLVLDPDDENMVINGHLNLWKGYSVEPRLGEWGMMKEHIRIVLADGDQESYEYILKWIAWAIQNPGQLAETAICFVGEPGTGKTSVGRWLLQIFGTHGIRPTSSRQVTGTFNFQLRDKVFLLMDEAINPESRAAANVMKGLITDKTLAYEAKGRDPIIADNMLKTMIISNHEHFIDVEEGDRRFAVFRVSAEYKQNDEYFKKLYAESGQGGVEAMLHDLLEMDLGAWHPRDNIPQTDEREKQKIHSFGGVDEFIYDLLVDGELPFSVEDAPVNWASTRALVELAAQKYKIVINAMDLHHNLGKFGVEKDPFNKVRGWKFPELGVVRRAWAKAGRPNEWKQKDFGETWDIDSRQLF